MERVTIFVVFCIPILLYGLNIWHTICSVLFMNKWIFLIILYSFFCVKAFASLNLDEERYGARVWLWPTATQIQIYNRETKATVLIYLKYDALKTFLSEFEINHAGHDPILATEIRTIEDLQKIKGMFTSEMIDWIGLHGARISNDELNGYMYSVFPRLAGVKTDFPNQKEQDVYMINLLLSIVLRPENYRDPKNMTPGTICNEYIYRSGSKFHPSQKLSHP